MGLGSNPFVEWVLVWDLKLANRLVLAVAIGLNSSGPGYPGLDFRLHHVQLRQHL